MTRRKADVLTRPHLAIENRLSPDELKGIEEEWDAQTSMAEIAKRYHISKDALTSLALRLGWKTREPRKANARKGLPESGHVVRHKEKRR